MSATNSTTHYQLSQFIGTDIPGWLSDYNSDNAKIDTGIFNAQSAAESAGTTATQAANDIQTINGTLTTQAAQISAAAQSASQAQTSAGQALTAAGTADAKADTNATAISALDTRVTALEGQGGGGGLTVIRTSSITETVGTGASTSGNYQKTVAQVFPNAPSGKTLKAVMAEVQPLSGVSLMMTQATLVGTNIFVNYISSDGLTQINVEYVGFFE